MYLSGESYSGHYTLVTSRAIIDSNAAGVNPLINFKVRARRGLIPRCERLRVCGRRVGYP